MSAIPLFTVVPNSVSSPTTFAQDMDTALSEWNPIITATNIATAALTLNATNDTSASSNAVGTGAKTWTVSASKSYVGGMWLVIADTAAPSTNSMIGQVTSYSGTTLIMNITSALGSGTKTAWTISQSAPGQVSFDGIETLTNKTLTAPVMTTPTLGVASATTVNKVTLTAPATGSTLTIADGKTLTASNTLTLAGTDGTTMTLPPASASLGYLGLPQNSQSAPYTLVIGDAGKSILHPSADTTARTFTIPANSSVAFPVGTAVTFVNEVSAGVMTIAITTDTMRLSPAGTTGSRSLAANGVATALKVTTTEWLISGSGLT